MNTYEKYKNSRDMSWRILIDFKLTSFPIDIIALIQNLNIELRPYNENLKIVKVLKPNFEQTDAFSNESVIFFKSNTYLPRIRFALAHELGHILHEHTSVCCQISDYEENQANTFARSLLMPAIVIKHEKLTTADQIADFFGTSHQSAAIRLERMKVLLARNVFGTSPLEREYCKMYKQYRNIHPLLF